VAGESVAVSPSQTLTLPASPTKGDIIQILALGTVIATTPVTVAAAGGKVINGIGLSAASSFLLGAANANATLQYDGTAWRMIAGAQDTGHLPFVSLATGFSFGGTPHAGARLIGNRVQLQSYMNYSGSTYTALQFFANLPLAIMEPLSTQLVPVGMGAGSSIYIQPGTIGLENQSAINSGWLGNFNGYTYLIDTV
jgi:hypothetical protein